MTHSRSPTPYDGATSILERWRSHRRERFGVTHLRFPRYGSREAGRGALAKFRAERRDSIRGNWLLWLLLAVLNLGAAVTVGFTGGTTRAAACFVLGLFVALAIVTWQMGGDPHNLTWQWGAVGERQTEKLLRNLDNSWECVHDISRGKGNWDHVLIGPAGVFLLDSKRFTGTSVAVDDQLRLGRHSYGGSGFRGNALSLKEELETRAPTPWVKAVVVIWGDFPQRRYEENKVAYLQSDELIEWLREQRGSDLSEAERKAIAQAARDLKKASRALEASR